MTNNEHTEHGGAHGTLQSYVFGFALSIALTLVAFYLVDSHVRSGHIAFSHTFVYGALAMLAIVQLFVQLVLFLHLGRGSGARWNATVFAYAFLLIVILVGGSLWIMANMDYNMLAPYGTDGSYSGMRMTPGQVDRYMLDQ